MICFNILDLCYTIDYTKKSKVSNYFLEILYIRMAEQSVGDFEIEEICQRLAEKGDLQTLRSLIQTSKNIQKLCQHYLNENKSIDLLVVILLNYEDGSVSLDVSTKRQFGQQFDLPKDQLDHLWNDLDLLKSLVNNAFEGKEYYFLIEKVTVQPNDQWLAISKINSTAAEIEVIHESDLDRYVIEHYFSTGAKHQIKRLIWDGRHPYGAFRHIHRVNVFEDYLGGFLFEYHDGDVIPKEIVDRLGLISYDLSHLHLFGESASAPASAQVPVSAESVRLGRLVRLVKVNNEVSFWNWKRKRPRPKFDHI